MDGEVREKDASKETVEEVENQDRARDHDKKIMEQSTVGCTVTIEEIQEGEGANSIIIQDAAEKGQTNGEDQLKSKVRRTIPVQRTIPVTSYSVHDASDGLDFLVQVIVWANIPRDFVMVILITYLTDSWKMILTQAAAIVNLQYGAMRILTITMAYLVETCVVSRTMFNLGNALLSIGLGFLSMSVPKVLSVAASECNTSEQVCIGRVQYALFYSGLVIFTIGMTGQWIGLDAFWLGRKFVAQPERYKKKILDTEELLPTPNGFLLLLVISLAFGLSYVKPWSLKFGIPAILNLGYALLGLSISCCYTPFPPQGSNLTRIFRVFVAAVSNVNVASPKDVHQLHKCNDDEAFFHTNSLRCLDKAAIVDLSRPLEEQTKHKWKLCCIEEVEVTKVMICMIPKCLPFIIFGLVISVGNTFFYEQGNKMNRKLGHIKVPLIILFCFTEASCFLFTKIYDLIILFSPEEDDESDDTDHTSKDKKRHITTLNFTIGIGMVFAVVCCIVAALVEKKRINVIKDHGLLDKEDERVPMSIFWLTPQCILLGMSKGLIEKGIECLLKEEIPRLMAGYAILFAQGLIGVGHILCVLAVYATNKVNEQVGKQGWFGDTLNKSRLDYFYWTLAVLSFLNLGFYVLTAGFFTCKKMTTNDEKGVA